MRSCASGDNKLKVEHCTPGTQGILHLLLIELGQWLWIYQQGLDRRLIFETAVWETRFYLVMGSRTVFRGSQR